MSQNFDKLGRGRKSRDSSLDSQCSLESFRKRSQGRGKLRTMADNKVSHEIASSDQTRETNISTSRLLNITNKLANRLTDQSDNSEKIDNIINLPLTL